MIIKRHSEIDFFEGFEKSKIKQYFGKNESLGYSLAYFELLPKTKTRIHKLRSTEIYFILNGKARIHIGSESEDIEIHDSVLVPKDTPQYIENFTDEILKFLCIVEPPWNQNDEEFLD